MHIPRSSLPHGSEPVAFRGNTSNPKRALILLHGRGASTDDILSLIDNLTLPDEYVVAAPQANKHTWYPERFIVPTDKNQPYLNSAIDKIDTILRYLSTTFAIKKSELVLAGFSQGACLAAEYVKRHPARYQGLAVFSGGLIGTDDEVHQAIAANLHGTPVYLGCDVADFHIPKDRVELSAEIFTAMNAAVELKLYNNLGHSIHTEGIKILQKFTTS